MTSTENLKKVFFVITEDREDLSIQEDQDSDEESVDEDLEDLLDELPDIDWMNWIVIGIGLDWVNQIHFRTTF